jgi:hypothetical protein
VISRSAPERTIVWSGLDAAAHICAAPVTQTHNKHGDGIAPVSYVWARGEHRNEGTTMLTWFVIAAALLVIVGACIHVVAHSPNWDD